MTGVVIYRYTNILSGKCYIGITDNPKRRKSQHRRGIDENSALYLAFKKHGEGNFLYEELACSNNRSDAYFLEKLFIRENNSFRRGYNRTEGGPGKHGVIGEKSSNSKITEDLASALILDPCSHKEASEKYGLNYITVQDIRVGRSWKHLDRSESPRYRNNRVKLSVDMVKKIISDPCSNIDAERRYATSRHNISAIRRGVSWGHVDRNNAPTYMRSNRWDR